MAAVKAFLRRWRWPALVLLAVCLVGMVVEVAITEYTPPLKGPLQVVGMVIFGTVYIWASIVLLLLPIILVVEVVRLWWRKRHEESERGSASRAS